MDFSEKWGKDEETAIKLALKDLGLTRDEVDIIVLEEASKGFFGIGSRLAKVRVVKSKNKPVEARKETKLEVKEIKKETKLEIKSESLEKEIKSDEVVENNKVERQTEKNKKQYESSERPTDLVAVESHPAIDFLKEITEKMGINVDISGSENENSIYVDINGKDSGTVIGKRGQTLDSIQYLTSLVVNKEDGKYKRVVVDAENYRIKREKTLEQLAKRLAEKVIKTRKSVRLEPMNPYERKVIHATLQSNPKIVTRSEGEEPYRRVIIELK